MYPQLNQRLAELNRQFEQGNARLMRIERERAELRETLFRIQGAILVLNELSVEAEQRNSPDDPVVETAEIRMPDLADDQGFED